jgi:hypothetical protein
MSYTAYVESGVIHKKVGPVKKIFLSAKMIKEKGKEIIIVPPANKGSQKHIQMYVNNRSDVLNDLIFSASVDLCFSASGLIEWVSPLANKNYFEYRDEEFLEVLGLKDHVMKLKLFWPSNGPSWDGIGKVPTKEKGPA